MLVAGVRTKAASTWSRIESGPKGTRWECFDRRKKQHGLLSGFCHEKRRSKKSRRLVWSTTDSPRVVAEAPGFFVVNSRETQVERAQAGEPFGRKQVSQSGSD